MIGLMRVVIVAAIAFGLAAALVDPAPIGATTLAAQCPPGYDKASATKELPEWEDGLVRARNASIPEPNRSRYIADIEQMIANLKACLGQNDVPKPQPTVSKPQPTVPKPQPTVAKPQPTVPKPQPTVPQPQPTVVTSREQAKPPDPNKPPQNEIEKQLEEITPNLAKAQEDLRRARDRLAKYNEAAAKQDLGSLRGALQDDLKLAEAEHKEYVLNLAMNLPGVLSEFGGFAERLLKAKQMGELAQLFEVGAGMSTTLAGIDAVGKAPPQIQAGWDSLKAKSDKGQRLTREDFEPLVEGTMGLVGALATAPGNPLELSKDVAEKLVPRIGFWLTATDTLINAGLVATSQARYWEVYNNLNDVQNAQQLAKQRFEIDIRKAEMREKMLREQANRWRALANGK